MYYIKEDIAISKQDSNSLVMISVLDSENCYFKVDGLGCKILLQMQEGKSLEQIKSVILEKVDIDSETLDRDVDNLIKYLLENNIIEKK